MMRSDIITYRLHLVSEALRKLELQFLLEPIVKKLIRMDAVPYGIQRVGDFVEIGFKNPTADLINTLDDLVFAQYGLDIYLLKEEDPLIMINIAGCKFQEEVINIQEYLRDAGKLVNFYRQTKKFDGHLIETGVLTFWFKTLDRDLEKKIDKRRRLFFNNERYEEMRRSCKEKVDESAELPVDPPASNVAPSEARSSEAGVPPKGTSVEVHATGGDREAQEPTGGEQSTSKIPEEEKTSGEVHPKEISQSLEGAASMDVDEARVKRKAEEIEEVNERQVKDSSKKDSDAKSTSEEESSEEEENPDEEEDEKQQEAQNKIYYSAKVALNAEEFEEWKETIHAKSGKFGTNEDFNQFMTELINIIVGRRKIVQREKRTKEAVAKAKETLRKK